MYKFFEDNKLIYNLQFGFRQKHSTSHALIHLTEKICEQIDSGKYSCRIFVDFQKAFDTVNHAILTQNYYGVRGKANNWFSYLKNRTQFVTINGFNSDLKRIVKRAEPCKCIILFISRILWYKWINPSLKEWRFWYLILTGNFLP